MLNTRCISAASTSPSRAMSGKTGGTSQAVVSMRAHSPLGTMRGTLS